MRLTVAHQVARNATSFPDRVAIEVLDGPTLTYGDVWRRVQGLVDALGDVAPGPNGPMVGMLLPNHPDAVLTYLAGQVAGVAVVPVNTRLAPPEIRYVMTDSGASVLLSAGELLPAATSVADELGVRLVDTATVATPDRAAPPPPPPEHVGPRPAVVAYTSGTTGFPKGAVVTNEGLLLHFMRWGWHFGVTTDQVMLVPGPLFHLSFGGLSMAALMIGGRLRLMPAFDPERACEEMAERCTWVFLVPSMTTMAIQAWERGGRRPMRSLRFLLSSGAPVPDSVLRKAMEAFPEAAIAEGYGWTECGWVAFEVKDPATLRPHSVGWPTVGYELAVLDDDRRPCPVGTPGEVAVRPPVPFAGYLSRPDATAAAQHDGYLLSGDLGILDDDGRLRIVDRKHDMIVSGGENVYSAEVERVLVDHPGVVEVAVVGRPDERWGEAVVAVVVPTGEGVDGAELQAFCRSQLAGYKCPKEVVLTDELPRNPMGKVQKFRIVESLAQRAGTPTTAG